MERLNQAAGLKLIFEVPSKRNAPLAPRPNCVTIALSNI